MKKIWATIACILLCAFIFACASTDSIQQAIDEKNYGEAKEKIENLKNDSDREEMTEIYEDSLFADAAQLINNNNYVQAYEVAQQSISGKALDAVNYLIETDFWKHIIDGINLSGTMMENANNALMRFNSTGFRNSIDELPAQIEPLEPYINLQEIIPKTLLPTNFESFYDNTVFVFTNTSEALKTLSKEINEDGVSDDYISLLMDLEAKSTTADTQMEPIKQKYVNSSYELPEGYADLLDNRRYTFDIVPMQDSGGITITSSGGLPTSSSTEVSSVPSVEMESQEPSASVERVDLPIEIEGIRYDTNSIGTPEIYIRVRNTGDVSIDAFDFAVKCYDNYGDLVKGYGRYDYEVCTYQSEDGAIGAGEVYSASQNGSCWTMYGYDAATHYEVAIIKVHTTDGQTYERKATEYEWVPQNE